MELMLYSEGAKVELVRADPRAATYIGPDFLVALLQAIPTSFDSLCGSFGTVRAVVCTRRGQCSVAVLDQHGAPLAELPPDLSDAADAVRAAVAAIEAPPALPFLHCTYDMPVGVKRRLLGCAVADERGRPLVARRLSAPERAFLDAAQAALEAPRQAVARVALRNLRLLVDYQLDDAMQPEPFFECTFVQANGDPTPERLISAAHREQLRVVMERMAAAAFEKQTGTGAAAAAAAAAD